MWKLILRFDQNAFVGIEFKLHSYTILHQGFYRHKKIYCMKVFMKISIWPWQKLILKIWEKFMWKMSFNCIVFHFPLGTLRVLKKLWWGNFYKNINLTVSEAYSEKLRKICFWEVGLNFVVMQFSHQECPWPDWHWLSWVCDNTLNVPTISVTISYEICIS